MPDREKVIKALECYCESDSFDKPNCKDCPAECMSGYMSIPFIQQVLAMLKKQEWIPVEERLPKSMANKVLVYLQHEDLVDQIGYGHYEKFKGKEMWYDLEHDEQFSKRGYTVTHWMPLPKSPKGERLTLS